LEYLSAERVGFSKSQLFLRGGIEERERILLDGAAFQVFDHPERSRRIVLGFGSHFVTSGREAFVRCRGIYAILLPASVEILEEGCFRDQTVLDEVQCEAGSRLRRIEREVFRESGLRSLLIPASTEFVDGSALICRKLFRVDIEVGNQRLVTDSCFIRSFDGLELIRYFGRNCWKSLD
jgi:hypothetical protein